MMKKPDATPQSILSNQLALCTEALRECSDGVRASRAAPDASGFWSAKDLHHAVALLEASAKVGATIARINGEFRQDITVRQERAIEGEGASRSGGSNGRDRDG